MDALLKGLPTGEDKIMDLSTWLYVCLNAYFINVHRTLQLSFTVYRP